jgi:stringent starvation protein B
MGPDEQRLPAKKDVAIALLEQSDVFVHIDPRPEEVRVPQWFKKQAQLVLQIGLNMPVPIRDLEVNDDSITCTLSFNRSPFFCFLPWKSIYALVGSDGRAMVWPDDIPPEVAAQAAKSAAVVEEKAAKRAHLRAVPAAGAPEPADTAPEPVDTAPEPADTAPEPADTAPALSEAARVVAAPLLAELATDPEPAPGAAESSSEGAPGPVTPEPPAARGKKPLPPWLRVVK